MPDGLIDLIDHVPQFIWTTGRKDLKLQYSNKTFLDFLGHPDIDRLSEAAFWQACMHPDDLARLICTHGSACLQKTPYKLEARFKESLTGAWCWYLIQGIPRFGPGGEYLGYIGTAVDISILKKAELVLKESEDRFRIMAEGTEILIAVSDETNNAIYFNNAWVRLTGRPMEQLLKLGWVDLVHPDDRDHYMKVYLDAAQKKESYSAEFRVLNKGGTYTWLLAKVPPRIRLDGSFSGHISSCIDITDRKLAEQQLKTQEILLEKLVSTRTSQLEKTNADLQQFVHVASHDLKEPVRKIKVFLSRIFQESVDYLPARIITYLTRIQSAAQRMTEIISGTLNYSIADAEDQLFESVDLNGVLQSIQADLEIAIQEKQATIEVADLPVLEGIPVMIYQLFYNLINNSLKFAKKDVLPFISITSTTVLRDDGTIAWFEIKDNGIGFQQAQAERIFHIFVRLNSKDNYEGTGLGLALCKKIVQRHNGTIEAESLGSAGAKFSITLPLKQNHA